MIGTIFTLVIALATFLTRFGIEDPSKRLESKRNIRKQKLDDLAKQYAQNAYSALEAAKTSTSALVSVATHEANFKTASSEFLRCCGLTADMRLFIIAYHVARFVETISGFAMVFFVMMSIPVLIRLLRNSGAIDPKVEEFGRVIESYGMLVVGPALAVLLIVAAVRLVLSEVDKLSVHEVE